MGSYNITEAILACPRCKKTVTCRVNLYFGFRSNIEFVPIGAKYPFLERRQVQNGGLFPDSNPWGEGYTECPECFKDFFCLARIEDQHLVAVYPDLEEPPYVPDVKRKNSLRCPRCNSEETEFHAYDGFPIGRLICHSNAGCRDSLFELDDKREPKKQPYRKKIEPN